MKKVQEDSKEKYYKKNRKEVRGIFKRNIIIFVVIIVLYLLQLSPILNNQSIKTEKIVISREIY